MLLIVDIATVFFSAKQKFTAVLTLIEKMIKKHSLH